MRRRLAACRWSRASPRWARASPSARWARPAAPDGTRQLTYRGHPLYRFAGDANQPGKVTGQGINAFGGRWWVVDAKGRSVTKSAAAATATPAPMPTDTCGY